MANGWMLNGRAVHRKPISEGYVSVIQRFDSPNVYTATCIFSNPNPIPNSSLS